jgi:hypothetical protein
VRKGGRPSKELLARVNRPWTKHDYHKLVVACVQALIKKEKDVRIAFHYLRKLPKDFPVGVREKLEDLNIQRIKAVKLLDWLHKHGHTSITTEDLRVQQIQLSHIENNLEKGI